MKGTILTALAAGALILAGCTKTEVTDVPDSRAISFDNFVTNAVKAPIDKNEALTTFFVYGGYTSNEVFTNQMVNVAWDKGTYTCTYTPAKYWTQGQTYYFAAYSDGNEKIDDSRVTFSESTGHLTISGYTVDAFDGDLIYGYADNGGTGYSYDGSKHMDPVPFDFKHILSKVTFKFSKAADLNGTKLTINNFSVNLKTTGTFFGTDLSGATQYPLTTWTASASTSAFTAFSNASLTLNDDVTAGQSATTVETGFTAIPQSVTGYTISFDVTYIDPIKQSQVTRNFENVSIANTIGNNWNPGYRYIYTAEIKAVNLDLEPIVFTVNSVEKWEEETVDDIIGNTEGII